MASMTMSLSWLDSQPVKTVCGLVNNYSSVDFLQSVSELRSLVAGQPVLLSK